MYYSTQLKSPTLTKTWIITAALIAVSTHDGCARMNKMIHLVLGFLEACLVMYRDQNSSILLTIPLSELATTMMITINRFKRRESHQIYLKILKTIPKLRVYQFETKSSNSIFIFTIDKNKP